MNKRNDAAAEARMPTAAELLSDTGTPPWPPDGDAETPDTAAPDTAAPDTKPRVAELPDTEAPDARALREAAEAEPGVRSRSCLVRTDDETGGTTVIVSIAVAYGLALHEVAEKVRKRVTKAAVKVLGVPAKTVTVDVKIVWLDEPSPAT